MPHFELHVGDCRDVLKDFPDNHFDSVVTDPPYGLSKEPDIVEVLRHWLAGDDYTHRSNGFMGKSWDSFVPGPSVWKEVFRVLKPGGHMIAFFGTRTFDLGVIAIRMGGFEIRDSLQWIYGSGFPKSVNISKAIDSGTGRPEDIRKMQMGEEYEESGRGRVNYDNGGGSKMNGDTEAWDPQSDEAKQWAGFGTALKPAHEPIVLARKPLIGTIVQNIRTHGVGGLNIDGCRIETAENLNGGAYAKTGGRAKLDGDERQGAAAGMFQAGKTVGQEFQQPLGRFPANVIHDGSEGVTSLFPSTKSGVPGVKRGGNDGPAYGKESRKPGTQMGGFGDEGSASRFFYGAKPDNRRIGEASAEKRYTDQGSTNFGALPGQRRDAESPARFFYTAKANKKDRGEFNDHPTVKPTDLMRYLCRLVTPPNGTILDPFMGSGTTGKAAVLESFKFVGIDIDSRYIEIARRRITETVGGEELPSDEVAAQDDQLSMF